MKTAYLTQILAAHSLACQHSHEWGTALSPEQVAEIASSSATLDDACERIDAAVEKASDHMMPGIQRPHLDGDVIVHRTASGRLVWRVAPDCVELRVERRALRALSDLVDRSYGPEGDAAAAQSAAARAVMAGEFRAPVPCITVRLHDDVGAVVDAPDGEDAVNPEHVEAVSCALRALEGTEWAEASREAQRELARIVGESLQYTERWREWEERQREIDAREEALRLACLSTP